MASPVPPLLAEGMRKAAILWVDAPGVAARLCWHIWIDDTAWVLHGGPEQHVPALAAGVGQVRIRLRSADNRALLVVAPAWTEAVVPDSSRWAALLPALLRARHSAGPDPASRWARECALTGLHPTGAQPVGAAGS